MKASYYDGTKLLSMKDINGQTPEIFMCTSNRTAGKTTWYNRYAHKRFKLNKEKYMLLYRFNYELDDVADKFFKDIQGLFFKDDTLTTKRMGAGIAHQLFCNDVPCGYAVTLNSADAIKKNSHLFSDTTRIIFDEFQSETNHYCPDEVRKFQSIHTSVARGQGKQVRYVPVFMISNPVTLINPYYTSMGISARLQENTKYLKGDGFVLEQGYNESASLAQSQSGFNRAFANDDYQKYSQQAVYLNDNKAFIEKPIGIGRYLATIRYMNKSYAIREYADLGIIYCDDRADESYPLKIATTIDDHNINWVMLKKHDFFISNLRYFFERGCFRFKDLQSKTALMATISYQ